MTRVRFAPSPTGNPHVGNLRTAIINWLFAQKYNGKFIARLEDTDRSPDRYKPEAIWDLEEAMRYLGIVPDEWWLNPGAVGPYVQSERLTHYNDAVNRLMRSGNAYMCFCTKERLDQMRKENPNRGYDRHCRGMMVDEIQDRKSWGEPHVIRLAIPEGKTIVRDLVRGDIEYDNSTFDDQVLLKSDGFPTYFLAAAVDDVEMGITHIIRGDDWLSSAAKLVMIWYALGVPKDQQPQFIHLPLIVGKDKAKLAKRHGSTTFAEFIKEGYLPEALFNYLILLGWSTGSENQEILSVNEAVEKFDIKHIGTSPAMFDYDKLKATNGHYIRQSPLGRIIALVEKRLNLGELNDSRRDILRKAVELERMRSRTIADIADKIKFFLTAPTELHNEPGGPWVFDPQLVDKHLLRHKDAIVPLCKHLALVKPATEAEIEQTLRAYSDECGLQFGDLAQIIQKCKKKG